MSSVEDKIKNQIEFYFSDSNLLHDKFLRSQVAMNPQGFVDISIIADFNRVKKHSEDLSVVVSALKNSDKLQVSKDDKMVRRVAPLPEEDVTLTRTIHMKEFPKDVTIDGLREFFSQYGTVLSTRIRRFPNKEPKGSAMVEFASEEEANKVLEQTIEYNGKPLLMTRKDKWIEKKKEKRSKPIKKEKSKEEKLAELFQHNKDKFSGCLVKITNIPDETEYSKVKDVFGDVGINAYIEMHGNEAVARLNTKVDAESALKELEGKEIGGQKIELKKVEEEEEDAFFRKKAEEDLVRTNSGKMGRHHGGGGGKNFKGGRDKSTGRKGKQRGKKRKSEDGENNTEQPPEKKIKTEE